MIYGIRPWDVGKLTDETIEVIHKDLKSVNGFAANVLASGYFALAMAKRGR